MITANKNPTDTQLGMCIKVAFYAHAAHQSRVYAQSFALPDAPKCPAHHMAEAVLLAFTGAQMPSRAHMRRLAACHCGMSSAFEQRHAQLHTCARWRICIAVYIRIVKYTATRYARKHIHPCARSAIFRKREPVHAARSYENARPQRYTYVMHSYAAQYACPPLSTNPCNLPYVPLLLVHIAWADYVRGA